MGLSQEEITNLKYSFAKEYREFIKGCGISILSVQEEEINLRKGESLNDLCLKVHLEDKIEKPILPDNYHGARVFYKVSSGAELLSI